MTLTRLGNYEVEYRVANNNPVPVAFIAGESMVLAKASPTAAFSTSTSTSG